MVKTLAGIVPSIPLELGFCSLQISHTSCCPFFVRVPPITTMGGYAGSCPSFLRVLPITGMGGCPGRCPFGLRVLPITGMGGRPFRLRVLPITGMGGRPFRLRVLPITGIGGQSDFVVANCNAQFSPSLRSTEPRAQLNPGDVIMSNI